MNETNGEKKKELVAIELPIFPDFVGTRVKRDIKIGDEIHKFTIHAPVVTTEEEAQAVYGVSLTTICEKGCLQTTYARDTSTANMIKEDLTGGVDFGALEDVSKYTNEIQGALSTAPAPREGARAKEKEELRKFRELDIDVNDADEMADFKKWKAKRDAKNQ